VVKSGCAKPGSGSCITGGGGSTTVVSVSSSISPSITLALTPASCAASLLLRTIPSCISRKTRPRAGVRRAGGGPFSRTPTRSRSGGRCAPMRKVMRRTMPRDASV
jgi:hypothetical protein